MVEVSVEGEILGKIVKGINILVSEARWHFNEDGLYAIAVDPANVTMVRAEIPESMFDFYKTEDEEEVIGVDLNRLHEIFKMKSMKKAQIELKTKEEKMILSNGKVKYSLAVIDPSAIRKKPKTPQLDLPAKIVLDAGEFKKIIELAEKISDYIILKSNESFVIEAEGDVDEIKAEFFEQDLVEFNKAEARSLFSIEYLKEFCKIAGSGDLLTIRLGKDCPGRFTFEFNGNARVEYILAPRLESEW